MTQKREARPFEPPPWEREQFEELERRRAEQRDERELDEAIAQLETRSSHEGEATGDGRDRAADSTSPPPNDETEGGPDEAEVAAMLAQLAAEEPSAERAYWKTGVAIAGLLGVLGCVLVVWGVAGMLSARRSGQVGLAGGTGLVVVGGLFVGASVWVVTSNLRKRGII